MGAVYKAEDTQLGKRLVATKEMSHSGLSQRQVKEAADAFKTETSTSATRSATLSVSFSKLVCSRTDKN